MNDNPEYLLQQILEKPSLRKRLAFEDPMWFSLLYLRHHFNHTLAPFHHEMFELLRQDESGPIVVMAFRESGKSTILNLANVLWSVLGKRESKFVVVLSKTQEQAKSHFTNIKTELEHNELLREDFGPFTENERQWNRLSLELEYHGSKIMSLSREQSARGLKYGSHRPDLIVCDDLEDMASVLENASREATKQHFESEIMPLGNAQTRIVVLGNLLSEDSLIMHLQKRIQSGTLSGIFRCYPLFDCDEKILWPTKFRSDEDIRRLKSRTSPEAWAKEYLLTLHVPGKGSSSPAMKRYERRLRDLYRRYMAQLSDNGFQAPLVEQMRPFAIAPPGGNFMVDESSEEYRAYEREAKDLTDAFHREYREEIGAQILAKSS